MLDAVVPPMLNKGFVFIVYVRCFVNAHITCPTKGLRWIIRCVFVILRLACLGSGRESIQSFVHRRNYSYEGIK